jgi:hypothetical protein
MDFCFFCVRLFCPSSKIPKGLDRNTRPAENWESGTFLTNIPTVGDAVTSELCPQCSKLDLDAAFSIERLEGPKELFSTSSDQRVQSCKLCNFLEILTSAQPYYKITFYKDVVGAGKQSEFSERWFAYPQVFRLPPTVVLKSESYESGEFIASQNTHSSPVRLLNPNLINFELVGNWLSVCREKHSEGCTVHSSTPVSYMKVIDCNSHRLVPAIGKQYVTLSYVWGTEQSAVPFSDDLPAALPPTIADAITVTLNLGYQFLWVDRYCINQADKTEAHAQIQRMGSIYQDSDLTIIAAAGQGPSYGLPGVGKRHRKPQPVARISGHLLVGALRNAKLSVEDSHWAKRGWTYQEALLSKRRLFFYRRTSIFRMPWHALL